VVVWSSLAAQLASSRRASSRRVQPGRQLRDRRRPACRRRLHGPV